MKKFWLFLLWLISFFGITVANPIDPLQLPKFEYFVNDYAGVLIQEESQTLNQLAEATEKATKHQIITVLFPHREGNELFDIALKAFNDNRIGDKKRNDGLLLAIATEEKKIRIMVWYGLEWEVPDLVASKIIETLIRPEVNNWNFYQAVKNFYSFFTDVNLKTEIEQSVPKEEYSDSEMIFLVIWIIFIVLLVIWGSGGSGGRSSWNNYWNRSSSGSRWGGYRSSGGFSGGWGRSWGGGAGD